MYITYDFETLGTSFNAPVIQIGAVKFNTVGEILDKFYTNINWNDLSKYSFTTDYPTLQWWMETQSEAAKTLFTGETMLLKDAFKAFEKWIGKPKDYYYWTHATFDPVIFANTCRVLGMDVFIPFRHQMDIRTLTLLAGRVKVEREGTAHNALDDAILQADYISKMLNKLNV